LSNDNKIPVLILYLTMMGCSRSAEDTAGHSVQCLAKQSFAMQAIA